MLLHFLRRLPLLRRLPHLALVLLSLAIATALPLPAATAAVPHPDLYVINLNANNILHYDGVTGAFVGALTAPARMTPDGIAFGPDGLLYVADYAYGSVLRFNPLTGAYVDAFIPNNGSVASPRSLVFGPDGSLYVGDGYDSSIKRFSAAGTALGTFVAAGSGGLSGPVSMAFGPDGSLSVASVGSGSVLRYDGITGTFLGAFVPAGSGGLGNLTCIAFGPDGNLYVAMGTLAVSNASILRYNGRTGAFLNVFVPTGSGGLSGNDAPQITFGPDGNLYAAQTYSMDVVSFNGSTGAPLGAFVPLGSGGLQGVAALAFGPAPPPLPPAQELIVNGGFETGDLSGWTVTSETNSAGSYYAETPTSNPFLTSSQSVGPASGSDYAASVETGPTASALAQTFTVPGAAAKVTLSYDMFVNDFSAGPVLGTQGLEFNPSFGANQQARVDLLTAAALPLSTAPADVLQSFFDGADSHALPNPHAYTHYSFDITPLVGKGGAYTLRFAQVDNQNILIQGVDNVSVQYTPAPPVTPPAPLTLTFNPGTVISGSSAVATVVLNQPAQPGPDPSGENEGQYGAVIRLDVSPALQLGYGDGNYSNGGFVFHGTDGTPYLLIPTGKTTSGLLIQAGFVSAPTTASLKATYGGGSTSAPLTINPLQVLSAAATPAAVIAGQPSSLTVTLNGPATVSPDPRTPGQTTNGALVNLSMSQAAYYSGYTVGQAYVLIPAGQTSVTVPIGTVYVPSADSTGITASFNGSSSTAPFTINPTLVQSLTLNQASAFSGQGATVTLTLNAPAIPGPSPAQPGTGIAVRLDSDNPAAVFSAGDPNSGGGAIVQGQDGHLYVLVPQGQATVTFYITAPPVTADTTLHISAALNGSSQTAALLIRPTVSSTTLINDTSSGIVYAGGGWFYSGNRPYGDVNRDVHATAVNGSSASYTFSGTGISYVAETNTDEGNVQVYLDGTLQATVSAYSAARKVQQSLYSTAGLTAGSHTLKLVKLSGSYLVLDAFQVTAPAASTPPTVVNDTGSGLVYTSGWFYSPRRGLGDVGDDVHATATNGSAVSYTFTGTAVNYITETNTDEGNVQVYLDGTLQTTVSAYSAARKAQQSLYSVTGLSSGSHTLKLVKAGGQYLLLDAISF